MAADGRAVGQQLIATPAAPLQTPYYRADVLVGYGLLAMDGALSQVFEGQLAVPAADVPNSTIRSYLRWSRSSRHWSW